MMDAWQKLLIDEREELDFFLSQEEFTDMENQLCIVWDEPDGTHNSDTFTLVELARAMETGAFTGYRNIKIELVPCEDEQEHFQSEDEAMQVLVARQQLEAKSDYDPFIMDEDEL